MLDPPAGEGDWSHALPGMEQGRVGWRVGIARAAAGGVEIGDDQPAARRDAGGDVEHEIGAARQQAAAAMLETLGESLAGIVVEKGTNLVRVAVPEIGEFAIA